MPKGLKLLGKEEVLAFRPKDRDMYIDKVLLDIIRVNDQGVLPSDLADATGFYIRTIRDHLDKLAAQGQILERQIGRGKYPMYYPVGEVVGKPLEIKSRSRIGKTYMIYKLDARGSNNIYIQERNVDSYGGIGVQGGITIDEDDLQNFIKSLHTFALKMVNKEWID